MTLNGRYGDPPRQLFRCYPTNGEQPHKFAPVPPRYCIKEGDVCLSCDTALRPHQGRAVASRYQFPAHLIAEALVRVGTGMSYTEAGRRARSTEADSPVVTSRQLVANWVEVWAPVVSARFAEKRWPKAIAVDLTTFKGPVPGGVQEELFHVFCAYGYPGGRKPGRLWALMAAPGRSKKDWSSFFKQLGGSPKLVVADGEPAIEAAVKAVFPEAVLRRCRWHLQEKAGAIFEDYGLADDHPLPTSLRRGLYHPKRWDEFVAELQAEGRYVRLRGWVEENTSAIRGDLTAGSHGDALPRIWTAGAAELALRGLRPSIDRRAFVLRNAARTNRMLELMRLHHNRWDDPNVYAAAIRRYLEHSGGRLPQQGQIRDRWVADPINTTPRSLRHSLRS